MSDRVPLDVRDDVTAADIPDDATAWLHTLRGPTLIRVRGRDRTRTRVVAGLLHGNEPSGLRAIHAALRAGERPETDVTYFLGAVEAAQMLPVHTRRMPAGRRDLNRCFRPPFDDGDGALAARVLELCATPTPEAVVDLHNNSGRNPCYGVVSRPSAATLQLVDLFCHRTMLSGLRLGTFMEAFEAIAPSVTIECGRAGDLAADAAAVAGLHRLLGLPRLDPAFVPSERMQVLVAPMRVRVQTGVRVAFGDGPVPAADVTFDAELDRHNFETLAAGTPIAWLRAGSPWPLSVVDERNAEVSRELFGDESGRLVARRSFMPIMMTTDAAIAIGDCLCYVAHQQQ